MALQFTVQLYRGTIANLASLATTTKAGVLAWATDSDQLYMDTGTGTAGYGDPGSGKAWQRLAAANKVWADANLAARTAAPSSGRTPLLGDLSVQADTSITYLLTALPSTTDGNWTAIANTSADTGDVLSVNSVFPVAGNVSLNLDNIPDGSTYARILKAVITAGEFDLAKSHQFGFTNDNLIQPSALGTWTVATPYALGAVIADPTNAGKIQQVVVAGNSDSVTQPTFSNTKGAITLDNATDGTVTWENIGTSLRVSVKWAASATTNEFVTYIDNDGVQHVAYATLAGLSDVTLTSPAQENVLKYDSGSSKWINSNDIDCGTF